MDTHDVTSLTPFMEMFVGVCLEKGKYIYVVTYNDAGTAIAVWTTAIPLTSCRLHQRHHRQTALLTMLSVTLDEIVESDVRAIENLAT